MIMWTQNLLDISEIIAVDIIKEFLWYQMLLVLLYVLCVQKGVSE